MDTIPLITASLTRHTSKFSFWNCSLWTNMSWCQQQPSRLRCDIISAIATSSTFFLQYTGVNLTNDALPNLIPEPTPETDFTPGTITISAHLAAHSSLQGYVYIFTCSDLSVLQSKDNKFCMLFNLYRQFHVIFGSVPSWKCKKYFFSISS